jgi:hypothetical protein
MDNGHEPATKADLMQLRDDLKETMRDMQTQMLKALYGFAQSTVAIQMPPQQTQ